MINQNLPAGPASIDLKVSGCVGKCRKADCFHSRNKINQNLSAGQTAACSVELVSGILIVFVIFSLSGVLSFIFAGRGARMRGQEPQGEGSLRCAQVSPLPKVLSLALPLSLPSPLYLAPHTFLVRGA